MNSEIAFAFHSHKSKFCRRKTVTGRLHWFSPPCEIFWGVYIYVRMEWVVLFSSSFYFPLSNNMRTAIHHNPLFQKTYSMWIFRDLTANFSTASLHFTFVSDVEPIDLGDRGLTLLSSKYKVNHQVIYKHNKQNRFALVTQNVILHIGKMWNRDYPAWLLGSWLSLQN